MFSLPSTEEVPTRACIGYVTSGGFSYTRSRVGFQGAVALLSTHPPQSLQALAIFACCPAHLRTDPRCAPVDLQGFGLGCASVDGIAKLIQLQPRDGGREESRQAAALVLLRAPHSRQFRWFHVAVEANRRVASV